jgi:hypothetical protein
MDNKTTRFSKLANRKCPNHSSTGKGKLKARNKNCHREKIAPTSKLNVSPIRINLLMDLAFVVIEEK